MRVSEICVKRIRVNQGLGVFNMGESVLEFPPWGFIIGGTLMVIDVANFFLSFTNAYAVQKGIKKSEKYYEKVIWLTHHYMNEKGQLVILMFFENILDFTFQISFHCVALRNEQTI